MRMSTTHSTGSSGEPGTHGPNPRRHQISRRTMAIGAAWSLPVVSIAAAAPAMAASSCATTTKTFVPDEPLKGSTTGGGTSTRRFPGLSGTNYVYTVMVDPTCPVTYSVMGGQGGNLHGAGGAVLSGTIYFPAGSTRPQLLTIVTGSGGRQGGTATPGYGGHGYGHGATAPSNDGGTRGGGGAGSAILLGALSDNKPLVVAGGGGGDAGGNSNGMGYQLIKTPSAGGAGGVPNGASGVNGSQRLESPDGGDAAGAPVATSRVDIHGPMAGQGAVGGRGGSGALATTWTMNAGASIQTFTEAGSVGESWPGSGNGGGNGGAPAGGLANRGACNAGGGGGGGYAGGGGGGSHWTGAGNLPSGSPTAWRTDGGGGGGGSSYVGGQAGAAVNNTFFSTYSSNTNGYGTPFVSGLLAGDGAPGYVTITYAPA